MSKLRKYQEEACQAVFESWKENQKVLLVLPTGTGKTVIFSAITRHVVKKYNKNVLILAHRGELLEQATAKLAKFDITAELEKAESHASDDANVVVASVQTLQQQNRLDNFSKNAFDYIIIDECHHATTNSYKSILEYFNEAKVLGVTATPKRSDARKLTDVFEDVAYTYDIVKAIKDGWLCDINIRRCPVSIDLSEARITAGDYNAGDLGNLLTDYLNDIINNIKTYAVNRKVLVFTPTIDIADRFSALLNENGFKAASVNGKSKDRDEIKEAFSKGELNVVCNCMLWTEGFDDPSVDCIINLRPTKSISLYTQIIGRGLRIHENKENLLVLDFLWHSARKGFDVLNPVNIFLDDEDVEYTEEYLDSGEEFNLFELGNKAHTDRINAEEKLMAQLELSKNKFFKWVPFRETDNPNFEYHYNLINNALLLDSITIKDNNINFLFDMNYQLEWYPMAIWNIADMTDKQSEFLNNIGINPENVVYRGLASVILNKYKSRQSDGLCSIKQYNFLTKRGYKNVHLWQNEEAKKVIGAIIDNHFRIPAGFWPRSYVPDSLKEKAS